LDADHERFATDICLARFCIRASGWNGRNQGFGARSEKVVHGKTYVFFQPPGKFRWPGLCLLFPATLKALMQKEMMQLPVLSLVLKQVQFVPIGAA